MAALYTSCFSSSMRSLGCLQTVFDDSFAGHWLFQGNGRLGYLLSIDPRRHLTGRLRIPPLPNAPTSYGISAQATRRVTTSMGNAFQQALLSTMEATVLEGRR